MLKRCWLVFMLVANIEAAELSLGASKDKAATTVGCLFPMNGRGGLYGRDSVVGIELAFEHLQRQTNAFLSLRVLVSDTSSKASKAARQARNFVRQDGVKFICGVVNSAIALQVAKIAAQEQVLFIGTDHASSKLTEGGSNPYYFRVNNNSAQSMRSGASYIREKFGRASLAKPLRIAYIGPDYDYGYQAWKDLRTWLDNEQVNYQVETVLWPKLYEPDYSPFLRALVEKKVDLVVNALWGGDLVAFIQQANQTTLFKHARFANFDTGGNYEVLAALGEEMPAGLILSSRHHNNWPDTGYNHWFVERFYTLTGRYPSYAAEGAYAGILAISEALRIAGADASNDKLRQVLSTLRLKLPEDPDNFVSFMNPLDHQLQQVIAIGETVLDHRYLPAQMMLGNWRVYYPQTPNQTD